MDHIEKSNSSAAKKDEPANTETWCLTRVGKDSGWLCLFENTEVTIGRGLNVTYQLLSSTCPLMISRLHCVFKQKEDGEWTVTDKKSLNGVWVNGKRIPAEKPHRLSLGDSLKLGVPIGDSKVEYEYILVRQPIKDVKPYLANEGACDAPKHKITKRKCNPDELEPSTSSKPKLYRCSSSDKSFAQPCPIEEPRAPRAKPTDNVGPSEISPEPQVPQGLDLPQDCSNSSVNEQDNLRKYSQNILLLREKVDSTQRQVAALEAEQQQGDIHNKNELLNGPKTLKIKIQRMETLEKSISETEKQLEVQKTRQQEQLLKKQLEEALQEQKKVLEELALSRQGFEEVLLAKDKELEVTKEEKEMAKAQKEEVVTQMTEVLENELQCIICSELFIQAVTLSCAHSFCLHCIGEWRKRKEECPICRQSILSQTRSLVLDNCIDRMVDNLSPDMKERRQALITERKGERCVTRHAFLQLEHPRQVS